MKTGRETEREPVPGPTYLIGLPSTIDPVSVTISFTVLPASSRLLFLTICFSYLGAQQVCRNEAAGTNSAHQAESYAMTTFDKREEGFEKKFAHDQELRFKANARRNKMLGLWAAEKLGLSGDAVNAYAKEVIMADFEEAGEADVLKKVLTDLSAKGDKSTEADIRRLMVELMEKAIADIQAS